MTRIAPIYWLGPSVIGGGQYNRADVTVDAENEVMRKFQSASESGDLEEALRITREHVQNAIPGFTASADPNTVSPGVTLRPAMGNCLEPYVKEGEFILETLDAAQPHRLAGFHLRGDPPAYGRVKVYLGAIDWPTVEPIVAFGDNQPKRVHFFYETRPICIFGVHEADIDRLRHCRRVRDPEELEPFPLQDEHWQAIAAGLRTPTTHG